MPFIFGLIGLLIGGALAYFFFQNKLQQIQRKLESSEKKLERANRALEDTESLRSQQAIHTQELQNARQQLQSVEASYQGQIRNLEESYELQLQEVEKRQGNPAVLADSQDRIRQIEQSYQAQIQELQANHQNEKIAIEQSYQAQIRELQQSYEQTLEEIQQTPPVQAFDNPPETSPETTEGGGWQGAAMGAAAIAGAAGLAGWATSTFVNREDEEAPVVEESSEEPIAESLFEVPDESPEEPIAESPIEVSEETPEENWADASLGEDLLEGADLSSWTESEPATVSGEITEELVAESTFEVPDEAPEENWADQPLAGEVAIESEMMGWTETAPVVEEPTEELVVESPFEVPDEAPEENWIDTPGEDNLLSGMDLSAWTDSPTAAIAEELTEEIPLVESLEQTSEEPLAESSFEMPEFTLEENWVDTPGENDLFGESELASWTNSPSPQLLEEPIQSLEETFETPDISFDLGESFDSSVEAELPSFENAEALTETSTVSELDFLSMLQTEEPSLGESEELSSFMDSADSALPDFLGEETLNDDLQLLDMFPPETEDLGNLSEPLTNEENAPFINFFDSEAEKSDLEFLEMLKTDDDNLSRLGSNETDDLFGDLFTPDDSPSPDIHDLFDSVESQAPKASQEGLEELFGDDTLSFDNWDLPSSDKPSVD
jgi:pilus assembly protein FimV